MPAKELMGKFMNGGAADSATDRSDDLLPIRVCRRIRNCAVREISEVDKSLAPESWKHVGFRGSTSRTVETVNDAHVIQAGGAANDRNGILTKRTNNLITRDFLNRLHVVRRNTTSQPVGRRLHRIFTKALEPE